MADIDPIEFGKLVQAVQDISVRMTAMEKAVAGLVALKDQGRGLAVGALLLATLLGAGATEVFRALWARLGG